MTVTLDINDSVKERVLWMLQHFSSDVIITENSEIENASLKESNELLEIKNSLSIEDTEIDKSATVEVSI